MSSLDNIVTRLGQATAQAEEATAAYKGAIMNVGYKLYRAFEDAVTLTQVNEAVQFSVGGIFYRWDGVFPQGGLVIPQNTPEPSPDQTGAGKYIAVLDLELWSRFVDYAGFTGAFATAKAMLASNIKPGKLAATSGYHSSNDGGGGVYYISSSNPGYGIPLANGNFAILCGDFDIRKFGIVSDPKLDQSDRIKVMASYADAIGIYEIDFHNFSLLTPTTLHFTTTRGAEIRGMGFNKVHKLKNLTMANNKEVQLVSGTCPIHFLPKDPLGSGVFALENTTFDPYVANYKLVSGEGDGMLFGFHATWHPDSGLVWPDSARKLTAYSFDFENINFATPAVSYNMSCHGFFSKRITANDLRGEYWGIYLVHHTERLIAERVNGVFRNDLHTPSGRVLVTNLIHEEAEIADDGAITRRLIEIADSSCYKKSGELHVVYKCHRIGNVTIDRFKVTNCEGAIELYGGDTETLQKRLVVESLTISDGKYLYFTPNAQINHAEIARFDAIKAPLLYNTIYGDLSVTDIKSLDSTLANGPATAGKITLCDILAVKDQTYGIVRSAAKVGEFVLNNVSCNAPKAIECDFWKITASGLKVNIPGELNNFFANSTQNSAFGPIDVSVSDACISASGGGLAYTAVPSGAQLKISNSRLIGVLHALAPTMGPGVLAQKSITWDPTSIAPNAMVTTTVGMDGAKVGNIANVAFSIYNASIEWSASVSANNTVTVKAKNVSGAAVDLPSGTLLISTQS